MSTNYFPAESILRGTGPLYKIELVLLDAEIDKAIEVLDILDAEVPPDYDELWDLWTDYLQRIHDRVAQSLHTIQRSRLRLCR